MSNENWRCFIMQDFRKMDFTLKSIMGIVEKSGQINQACSGEINIDYINKDEKPMNVIMIIPSAQIMLRQIPR